ncbi:MAG: ATP-binding protein [Burkholderiales bacterium]|nr:Sensor histidine kinase RcsC [Stenotrophomonas lactitubi]
MPDQASPVRLLARRSLWLHGLLIGMIAVATIQAGLVLSSALQLLREEQQKIDFHFRRLSGSLREQERFMIHWQGRQPEVAWKTRSSPGFLDPSFYPATLAPFSVVGTNGTVPPKATAELGETFSNFYGTFWSGSRYPSPRCLLLDGSGKAALLVPHALAAQPAGRADAALRVMLNIIHTQSISLGPQLRNMGWYRRDLPDGSRWLLSVMRSPQDASAWADGGGTPAISCMLDVSRIDDHQQVLGEPTYDRLSIVAPNGQLLYGPQVPSQGEQSTQYTADSVIYRMRDGDGWQAVYQVDWARLLQHQRALLVGSVIAALLLAISGALALRSYRRSVLLPLRSNHERLMESEAFSRTVLEAAPIGLYLLRSSDGAVVLENSLARAWLGGRHDAPGWEGEWRSSVLAHSQHGRALPYQTRDGRNLLVSATHTRYRGESVILCLLIDLTAQREAEQVLQQARQEADQANRAKSMFLATMSHEIRTPLYGVLGTLELLELTALSDHQKEYLSTIQRSSSMLMQLINDILDVSKAEAGQLVLEPVHFCPGELTEDVLRSYAAAASRKHLQLYSCIAGDVPGQVRGDATRIRQVLNNLVSNAIKFTEAGRVVVRLHAHSPATAGDQVALSWQVADTGIGIQQHHQSHLFEAFYQANPGIDAGRGTGLGLSISAQLVALMGGELRVVSDIGLGSSFSFQLPLERSAASVGARQDGAQQQVFVRSPARDVVETLCERLRERGFLAQALNCEPVMNAPRAVTLLEVPLDTAVGAWDGPHVVAHGGGGEQPRQVGGTWLVSMYHFDAIVNALLVASGRALPQQAELSASGLRALGLSVLVAEDNPINQMILREQLEELGCHAVVAGDGEEAMGYWSRRRFDVVVTDLNMPHLDGLAFAHRLRALGATVPIFGATANADPAERDRCRQAGMDDCLVKPILLDDLYRCLAPLASADMAQLDTLSVPLRMQELFLATMRSDMAKLTEAIQAQDSLRIKDMLHRLRGALVMVAAHALVDEGKRIEERLDAGASPEEYTATAAAYLVRLDRTLEQLSSVPTAPEPL